MRWIFPFLLIFAILLTACACGGPHALRKKQIQEIEKMMVEADERMVRGCQYLGSVSGTVEAGKIVMLFPEWRCKRQALRQAAELGATHIVWLHVFKTSAEAMAYKCKTIGSGK